MQECTKTKFANEEAAMFTVRKIKETSTRDKIPTRAYKCFCGSWHLTSRPDVFQLQNDNIRLEKANLELQKLVDELRETLANINKVNEGKLNDFYNKEKKEFRYRLSVDMKVSELNSTIAKRNKEVKNVREDNRELITQIVKLNDEVERLKNKE